MKNGSRMHRLLCWWQESYVEVYWGGYRERRFELALPYWPWRLYCKLYGHEDDTYGACVYCHRDLSLTPEEWEALPDAPPLVPRGAVTWEPDDGLGP